MRNTTSHEKRGFVISSLHDLPSTVTKGRDRRVHHVWIELTVLQEPLGLELVRLRVYGRVVQNHIRVLHHMLISVRARKP